MNVKKLAIFGAIALVIIGCVLAAGCTSTTTQQTQTSDTTSDNPWVGLWTSEYKHTDGTSGTVVMLIKADGNALWEIYNEEELSKSYKETWKKTGDKKITLTNNTTGKSFDYVFDSTKEILTENADGIKNVYKRVEPILGTWGTICKEYYCGNEITTFLADGTGKDKMMYLTEETEDRTFTWTKTGVNTYKLTYSNGEVWETKIIDDEKELEWKLISLKDQILGTRSGTYERDGNKINDITTFKGDFTGVSVGTYADAPNKEKINEEFTWKKIGLNTYILSYDKGDNIVKFVGVYNQKDNTVDYTLIDLSKETIVGTHKENETEYDVDGITETTFNANGTGKEVQTTKAGFSQTYDLIWNKSETENTYNVIFYGKNLVEVWTQSYDKQTDSLDSELHYYLWDDNYRYMDKHYLDIQISNDETGVAYEYDENGDMEKYKTTWEEIKTNVFKITYEDGDVYYAVYSPETDSYEWRESI